MLIAGLSPPRRGFDARSVHVRFVVDKGGTGSCFSPEYFDFLGARGDVVVKALRYKPVGRGFDSRWCHWNFSVT